MSALWSKVLCASVFSYALCIYDVYAMDKEPALCSDLSKSTSSNKIIPIKPGLSAEPINRIIPIKNGLLTEIDAIIYVRKSNYLCCKEKTVFKRATLAKLVYYEKKCSGNKCKIFAPQVFRVTDTGASSKGQLSTREPSLELLEAIRRNQALYYAFGYGALIYSIDDRSLRKICPQIESHLIKAQRKKGVQFYKSF
jgi:hypothetical protein